MEAAGEWSPYLTLDDAYRLDDIRDALRWGDIRTASRMARVYKLTPVEIHRDASSTGNFSQVSTARQTGYRSRWRYDHIPSFYHFPS